MKKLFLQLCRCRLCYIFLSYRCKRNNQFPNKLLYKLHTLTIPIVLIVPFVAHRQWMLAIVQQRSFTDFPNLIQHAFSQLVMRQTQVCFIPDLNNTRFRGHASQVQSLKFLTYQIYPQTQNMSQEVILKKCCSPCTQNLIESSLHFLFLRQNMKIITLALHSVLCEMQHLDFQYQF